jgi:hypothetical protein
MSAALFSSPGARRAMAGSGGWLARPAGFTVLTGCLVAVGCSRFCSTRQRGRSAGGAVFWAEGSWSTALAAALCAWLAVVFIGTEMWFSRAEVVEVSGN